MNHSEERLSKAFRDLAAQAPSGAPAELGVKLKDSLRRHHIRRRRGRILASAVALAVCLVFAALLASKGNGFFFNRDADAPSAGIKDSTGLPKVAISQPPSNPDPNSIRQEPVAPQKVSVTYKPNHNRTSADNIKGFIPLPTYHSAFPVDGYQIVRVGLRDTALSQLGLPVREDSSDRQVVADLLVDSDGLPMAVRFVGRQRTR